ncbi:hypothetical protein L2E82_45878 [Cichorium intybus]|uniref:Uncharacterized protein n=1 Tax=Cichorium intybus TaxID=13427 RepID=A0ACB8ZV45_CICIN|nr:hypothetical protein L2E82_45878 [Cichorium intybus]
MPRYAPLFIKKHIARFYNCNVMILAVKASNNSKPFEKLLAYCSIPEYIEQMSGMKNLDLSFNRLTGQVPDSIGRLSFDTVYVMSCLSIVVEHLWTSNRTLASLQPLCIDLIVEGVEKKRIRFHWSENGVQSVTEIQHSVNAIEKKEDMKAKCKTNLPGDGVDCSEPTGDGGRLLGLFGDSQGGEEQRERWRVRKKMKAKCGCNQ